MPDTTTLNETTRSTLDGTEYIRLATVGNNWKAQLGTQNWVFGTVTIGETASQVSASALSVAANTNSLDALDAVGFGGFTPNLNLGLTNAATNTPTSGAVTSGQGITGVRWWASDGTAYRQAATILVSCDATPATSTVPGRISLLTTTAGSSQVPAERMRVDSNGLASFTRTNGFGYGISGNGDGGTVTQITSRTTGVTLNTICGAITLFAAAPVVGTWVSFTVTNSKVAATDVVIVSVKSGTNTYVALVSTVAAGSFQITFQSVAGTASDSPVINFAAVKAVAA